MSPTEADLLIGIDQGTSGNTVLVVDRDLKVHARASVVFPQHYPQPGWVEHDPDEIWTSMRQALRAALEGIDPRRLAGLGITNQRETVFAWDEPSDTLLGNAIVWQDRRGVDWCERMQPHQDWVRTHTGLPIDPYFSAAKLAWLKAHHHGRPFAFGTADTHLLWRLSGRRVTDPSNASRTLLCSLESGRWSDELGARLGLADINAPEISPSAGIAARVRGVPELPDGLPIAGIAGDQQAALFGQGCFAAGQAKITYGTGSFVLLNTGERPVASRNGMLGTIAWELGGVRHYALEGGAFMAGALVAWLRDGLGLIEHPEEITALAQSVPDSGGVTVVPAHAGLAAPHWRPQARGLIHGLTRATTRAHIARAALEAIAHSQCDILEAMQHDLGQPLGCLRVDGGAAANDLLMQLQADYAGVQLDRPPLLETTALGAAMLAGLGVGMWPDLASLDRSWRAERSFRPSLPADAVSAARARWKQVIALA